MMKETLVRTKQLKSTGKMKTDKDTNYLNRESLANEDLERKRT